MGRVNDERLDARTAPSEADGEHVSDPALRAAFAYCHRITRRRAGNFYHGLKLTPEPKRSAMYAIYAFMRACDDLADGEATASGEAHTTPNVQETASRIERFRETMQHAIDATEPATLPPGELWPAFHHVVKRHGLDPAHFHAMLDGQRQDLTRSRYDTFEELSDYCHKVASSVGLVCLEVWGHDGEPQARTLATYRGIAFQLTNILRDLHEDARRGRVYLPLAELDRFGYSVEELLQGTTNSAFDRLMMYQLERAQSYYEVSAPLERHIAPDCRATSAAMTGIYHGLLNRIVRKPRRVLSERVRLGKMQKITVVMRAVWQHRRSRSDPQSTRHASGRSAKNV